VTLADSRRADEPEAIRQESKESEAVKKLNKKKNKEELRIGQVRIRASTY
jgi:hypothetical protein